MKKKTLTEEFRSIEAQIKEYKDRKRKEMIPEVPKKVFLIVGLEIVERPIVGAEIYRAKHGSFNPPTIEKRATKKALQEIRDWFEDYKNSPKRVVLSLKWEESRSGYSSTVSTGIDIDKMEENGYSYTKEALKPALTEKIDTYNKYYKPRDGHTPCQRCGRQTPSNELIESTIIGRGSNQVFNSWKGRYEHKACVTKERLKFCSPTCAAHEQMSREG